MGTALLLAAIVVPAAYASETVYGKVGEFGEVGAGNGQFAKPEGIAVDPTTGDIFVADSENHRVDVFQPTATSATYVTEFGEGQLSKPVGVAIDPTTGAVYVEDAGLNEIVKYDQTAGSPPTFAKDTEFVSPTNGTGAGEIGSFGETNYFGAVFGGIAVDPTAGGLASDGTTGTHDILVADPANKKIERFTSKGTIVKSFDGLHFGTPFVPVFTKPSAVAVNSSGELAVANVEPSGETASVLLYNGAGEYQATLGPVPNGFPSLTGLAVGIDTATGQAFVTSKYPESSSPGDIYRFSAPSATLPNSEFDHFEVGNHGVFSGIALRPASGSIHARLYAVAGIENLVSPRKVLVFEALTPPEVAIASTSATTATSATFHGTVNPEGTDAKWHFEYRVAGGSSWTDVPTPDGDAGSGETAVAVEATATVLEPNTEYEVRLHASNNAGATSQTSATASLTTKATPPAVQTGHAASIGDTSVTLVGTVNPRNAEVSDCHFAWGTGDSYGNTASCATLPGSGGSAEYVTAAVSGLSPTGTYHVRLFATNKCAEGCGTSEGGDSTFTTRSSAEVTIPERGYELVSAANTNGLEAQPDSASPDGEDFAYWTFLPTPGAKDGGLYHFFRATRGSDGTWSQAPVGADAAVPTGQVSTTFDPFFSEDFSITAFGLEAASLNADDQNGAPDIYRYRSATNSFTWVSSDPEIPAGTPQTNAAAVNADVSYLSADGQRVLFQSTRRLLSAATEGVTSLYEWDKGVLSLVAIRPESSSGFTAESALGDASATFTDFGRQVTADAVSRDGARVVFEAREGSAPPQLYVRLHRTRTVDASAPAAGAPAANTPYNVEYWGADAEDDVVYFTSSSPLTAESTAPATNAEGGCSANVCDLYAYDVASGALRDLTPSIEGGGVERVWDVSETGARLYFTSSRQLNKAGDLTDAAAAGEQVQGAPRGPNLYLAELEGSQVKLSFIATVEPGEPTEGGGLGHREERFRETAANPSGELFAFRSAASLVPGRSTGGYPQVFVYDATRRELNCASCPGDGAPATAEANLSPSTLNSAGARGLVSYESVENPYAPRARNVSSDGAVFFQSASTLVPGASNGNVQVYEWRGGTVGLISPGSSDENAMLGDATAGSSTAPGATVFFRSAASLVPGSQSGVQHIYAARVGGGYQPPTPAPPCAGGDCGGSLTAPPGPQSIGSAIFSGAGNLSHAKAKPKPKRLTPKQRLKRALKECEVKYRHNAHKRQLCKRRVRSRFLTRRQRLKIALHACKARHRHNRVTRGRCKRRARARYRCKARHRHNRVTLGRCKRRARARYRHRAHGAHRREYSDRRRWSLRTTRAGYHHRGGQK